MGNTMHHIHLPNCPSTQLFLKENYTELQTKSKNILISTERQTQGLGRGKNIWEHLDNSLAFSFTLEPLDELTLTPLELGIHLVQFLRKQYSIDLKLKWPNDLLNLKGEKCGGILCHNADNGPIIAGVGLNFGRSRGLQKSYKTPVGQIHPDYQFNDHEAKSIPLRIYEHILNNRISPKQVQNLWKEFCFHQNQEVQIEDNDRFTKGKFLGIGEQGEAIIQEKEQIKKLFSGSLYLI